MNSRLAVDAESLRIDREHYWHPFTQMAEYEPLIFDRGDGVWLYDQHGRRVLDGISSMWCNVHGHRHPKIDAAIREQLERVAHVSALGASNSTTIELTRRLVAGSPPGLECVFYSSDGSCAVEVALKMAFQYWRQRAEPALGRDLFLAVGDAYHGDTLGSVSVGGISRFHAMFDPLLFETLRGPSPDVSRLPPGTSVEQAAEYFLSQYADLMRRFARRLAAVIVEPIVQGAAGIIVQPPGFLSGMRRLASEHDVLLIADEIAVGMGRTGRMWACEWEDVTPDLLCVGKGLSGGYLPMAATLTTREVWDAFLGDYAASKSFFHGHTYAGNPLGSAAAVANWDLYERQGTLANVRRQGALLEQALAPLREHPHVAAVRCLGLMAAVELIADRGTGRAYPWAERRGHMACQAALGRGVWLRPLGNAIVIMPPLCCEARHVEQIAEAVAYGVHVATA